jgi:hypothetical protein
LTLAPDLLCTTLAERMPIKSSLKIVHVSEPSEQKLTMKGIIEIPSSPAIDPATISPAPIPIPADAAWARTRRSPSAAGTAVPMGTRRSESPSVDTSKPAIRRRVKTGQRGRGVETIW